MNVAQRGTVAGEYRRKAWGLVAGLVAAALVAPAHAEDLKGRYYFGGHLGYLSTTGDIRSNADIILGPYGDDNIPFTGDPNEEQGCVGALSAQTFCDPRPDDLLAGQNSIQETFRFDIDAGYGITSWLNLQVDASYFKGNVGPISTFLRDRFPIAGNAANPSALDRFKDREMIIPVQAGEITEIPVSLSAVARFRKDSPLNPYVGVGIGMIFANIDRSSDVDELNNRIAAMRVLDVTNEWNESIKRDQDASLAPEGRLPFRNPLRVDVKNSYEWHLMAGAEYFFNDSLSLVFGARYIFADEYLEMDLGGEDQINLQIFSEEMFHPDGSAAIFSYKGEAPNTPCANTPLDPNGNRSGDGCDTDPMPKYVTPGIARCPGGGDFDNNGLPDKCYGQNVGASPSGGKDPKGVFIVQGGRISLTGFAVAIGARFHF